MSTQVCRICRVCQSLSEYHKDPSKKAGVCNVCKVCKRELNRLTQLRRIKKMNQSRFQSIYNGLPQNLKKVYDVVPIRESWGESMIMAELSRLGLSFSGDKAMIGTLNRLKDLGLIKETDTGKFKKEEITEKVVKKAPIAFSLTVGNQQAMTTKETKTPLYILNDLALQTIQIAGLLKKLSSDIESAAINIDDHIAFTAKDSIKLKQLQDLLKG